MNPLDQLAIPLLEWYRDNRRTLPWREKPTPYRVWVSEIMLQQTRVSAVLDYFTRFMEALPRVEDLASVPEDRLLKLWQGLGYYSRARNLQKAAQQIMTEFGGNFPSDYAQLRTLAGVGEYTAAAISSIAFDAAYPAVDGNLLRVVARLTADFDDIRSPAMKKKVTQALAEVIPLREPGIFNQAMMDLGAMICLPNGAPLCAQCPLSSFCLGMRKNVARELPVRRPKPPRRVEERDVCLFLCGERVALCRRPPKGLLAKLWEFPNCLRAEELPLPPLECALPPRFAGVGRHIFTHLEWHLRIFVVETEEGALPTDWVWATRAELREHYAIPTAFSACFPVLEEQRQLPAFNDPDV